MIRKLLVASVAAAALSVVACSKSEETTIEAPAVVAPAEDAAAMEPAAPADAMAPADGAMAPAAPAQ